MKLKYVGECGNEILIGNVLSALISSCILDFLPNEIKVREARVVNQMKRSALGDR
jgi:hypothetical protein